MFGREHQYALRDAVETFGPLLLPDARRVRTAHMSQRVWQVSSFLPNPLYFGKPGRLTKGRAWSQSLLAFHTSNLLCSKDETKEFLRKFPPRAAEPTHGAGIFVGTPRQRRKARWYGGALSTQHVRQITLSTFPSLHARNRAIHRPAVCCAPHERRSTPRLRA